MMKCAIYNHPLVDGVLVEKRGVINFIRKRITEFRTMEKICRTCKESITKIYYDKMRRAIALQKSRLRDSSIPSISSTTSSSHHATSHHSSSASQDSYDRLIEQTPNHVKIKRKSLPQAISTSLAVTPSVILTSYINATSRSNKHSILQENLQSLTTDSLKNGSAKSNSQTLSSRIAQSGIEEVSEEENFIVPGNFSKNPRLSQEPTTSKAATSNVTVRKRTIPDYLKAVTSNTRRDLEQSTTSKAAATENVSRKRPISEVVNVDSDEDDDDEPRLSLNAFNGTRLPNIQPMPPKRKPRTDLTPSQLAMEVYARDITGG